MELVLPTSPHPDGEKSTPLPFFKRLWASSDKAKPAPTPDVVFARREFTEETGTMNKERVYFDESMQLQYRTYLENHLDKLTKLYKKNSASPLFTSDKYRHQMALMERLCGGDAQSGFTLDSKRIGEELKKDPDLWIVATQMMEEDIALTTWGMGQLAAVDPGRFNKTQGVFDAKPGKGQIKLHINQGWVNSLKDNWGYGQSAGVGLVAGATLAGFGAAGPVGALVGGVAGWGTTVGLRIARAGISSLAKNGVSIRINDRPGLMAAMQDPSFDAEATYLSEILDLEVSDFTIHRPGPLGRALRRKASVERNSQFPGSKDIAKVQDDLMSKMLTRYNFYTSEKGLHIPPNKVNMIPENIYFDAKNHSGVRTVWEKEMQNERNEATELFERQNGRRPNDDERMQIDQEARKKTIMRRLEKALIKDLNDDDKTIQMFTDREAAFSKGEGTVEYGREILKLTKELKEEKEALDAIDGVLSSEQPTLKTLADKQKAYRDAQEAAKKAYGTSELAALKKIKKQREKVDDTRLDTLIQQLSDAETAMETARVYGEAFDSSFGTASAELALLTAIDVLLAAAVPPIAVVGLSSADIASLPMSEIMRRVNVAYESARNHVPPVVLPGAWSSEQNLDLSKREQILYIIADARARTVEPLIATPGADFTTFTNAIGGGGYNLNENFIRSATVVEIIAEVNRNTGGATLDAGNPAHVTQIQTVMDVASRRYTTRRDKLQGVLAQEPAQREQYNSRVRRQVEEQTRKITEIDRRYPHAEQGGDALIPFRTENAVTTYYLTNNFADYEKGISTLEQIHTSCVGKTGYGGELAKGNLAGKTLQQIFDAINIAKRTHGVADAWEDIYHKEDDHVRAVISAHVEAKVIASNPGIEVDGTELASMKAHGLTEQAIYENTSEHIIQALRTAGIPITAAIQTQIHIAKGLVTKRFNARKNVLMTEIRDAKLSVVFPFLADADEAFSALNNEYTGLKVAISRRKTLQEENSKNQEFGDMSAAISRIQTSITTYDTARNDLKNKRREITRAFDGKPQTLADMETEKESRSDHPMSDLESSISNLETAKEALKTTSAEVMAAKKITDELSNSFTTVTNIDAQLVGAGLPAVGLDTVALSTLSYPEICRRINAAYVAGAALMPPLVPPVGWPKERNGEKKYQDMVGHAIVGAGVENKKNTLIAGLLAVNFADYVDVSQLFDDYEMHSLSPSELIAEATARGALRVPPIVPAMDVARAQAMLELYVKLYQTNEDASTELIARNAVRTQDISYESTHIAESFDDRKEFITRTKEMAKSQGKMYGRIPGFIHSVVNDPDFARPINPADVNFAGSERIPTPRGGVALPDVPKGYYELMNFMFNYYDTVAPPGRGDPGRGEAFQKLLNVEHFRPDRLAQAVSQIFGFIGPPPYTMQEVCVNLQTKMRDGSITSSDFYHGIKGVMDSYISEIRAMS